MNKTTKASKPRTKRPAQHQQRQPGIQSRMRPKPVSTSSSYRPASKLMGRVALITGGDSGIGRSVAQLYALEGADVAISYLDEHDDAKDVAHQVARSGRRCLLLPGDIGDEDVCEAHVERVIAEFGSLDILVNNAAEQHPRKDISQISAEQLERTFRTNVFSFFFLTKAALPHLRASKGSIINTTSVTAYRGSPELLDYSATKGAIVAYTRSLAQNLAQDGVRVNAVAPGPIWTPLIPSTFDAKKVARFGSTTPMGRAGEPAEVGPCFVFLASSDASYITGQVLHPNGGEIVNA
ncbi:MAG: glucose 1-dehydrogenase [Planctomycetes bacterium]|nr:glucose 1-dehydrogenase [Planctomycetota bacterium]